MEAMKCFPPTSHRTEKSGSKQPELRGIRPSQSTITRHQVLTTASQSSLPACPVTSGTRRAAGSASPGRSHTSHRQPSITRCQPDRAPPAQIELHPPPAAGHRTLPAQAQDRKPQQQVSHRPPPTATDHRRPAAGPASSPCTASRSPPPVASFSARRPPPPSDPSWGRHRLPVGCFA